jgi:hypothetical protein
MVEIEAERAVRVSQARTCHVLQVILLLVTIQRSEAQYVGVVYYNEDILAM